MAVFTVNVFDSLVAVFRFFDRGFASGLTSVAFLLLVEVAEVLDLPLGATARVALDFLVTEGNAVGFDLGAT